MIYLIVSFVLDILFNNIVSTFYGHINIFFPCFLVSSFCMSYLLFKNKKLFLVIIVLLGLLYDILFSEIALINLYSFLIISIFINYYYKKNNPSLLNIFIISISSIVFYDIFIFFSLILLNVLTDDSISLYYKIYNSLLSNIIYILLSIFIFKSRIMKEKRNGKVF